MDETAARRATRDEPEVVAELEARRLLLRTEDRGTAKVLVLVCDEQQVEISSEPGPLTTAAGGFEELAMEAHQIAALLRARAERHQTGPIGVEEIDWWTPPEVTTPADLPEDGR